jgi:hypothetical protein
MKTQFWCNYFFLTALLILVSLMSVPDSGTAAKINGRNDLLLGAISPFEDILESAMAKDDRALASSVAAATGMVASVKSTMSPEAFKRFDQHVSEINAYSYDQRYDLVSLQSLEAYKVLAEQLDPAQLKIPLEVIWLDYIGFEIQALSNMTDPNWNMLQKSVEKGFNFWPPVEQKITSNGLRDTYNTTLRGLAAAIETKNIPMLQFAARIDLDLVDLLENYFE